MSLEFVEQRRIRGDIYECIAILWRNVRTGRYVLEIKLYYRKSGRTRRPRYVIECENPVDCSNKLNLLLDKFKRG